MSRGFTQLAVEMIALDKSVEETNGQLYGTVTTGREWHFGKLDRKTKTISESIDSFTIPGNLEEIVRMLVGILEK